MGIIRGLSPSIDSALLSQQSLYASQDNLAPQTASTANLQGTSASRPQGIGNLSDNIPDPTPPTPIDEDIEPLLAIINGTNGDDTLEGTAQDDLISGLGGNDLITGGLGDDDLRGGSGIDTLVEEGLLGTAILTNTSMTGRGSDRLSSFELAQLSGESANNTILANEFLGAVTLDGGAGNDALYGSNTGFDVLEGGIGDDFLAPGGGEDVVNGGAGIDTVYFGGFNDALIVLKDTSLKTDTPEAGTEIDTLSSIEKATIYGSIISALSFTGSTRLIGAGSSLGGDDIIWGSIVANDDIEGRDGDDRLAGNGGNDTIEGGAGDDVITGGLGNDIIDGGEGRDTLIESGDVNFLLSSDPNAEAGGDATLTGQGTDRISGIEQVNLTGGSGGNALNAFDFRGTTKLRGQGGNDAIYGSFTHKSDIDGGDGNDYLVGGYGGVIKGGDGDDLILPYDSPNSPLLPGEFSRSHSLTGGMGADRFRLSNVVSYVTIEDFTGSEDRLEISASGFNQRFPDAPPLKLGVASLNEQGGVFQYDDVSGFLTYRGAFFARLTNTPSLSSLTGAVSVVN